MVHLASLGKNLQHGCTCSCAKLSCFFKSTCFLIVCLYRYIVLRVNPFSIYLIYFFSISFLGFGVLKALKPRTDSFRPKSLDLFFMSVSAATVSSMSTVEMEGFSNTQLIVFTVLMFIGGEVFTSMVGLHLKRFKLSRFWKTQNKVNSSGSNLSSACSSPASNCPNDQIELGMVGTGLASIESKYQIDLLDSEYSKYKSIKFLSFVVLGYLLVVHVIGVGFLLVYLTLASTARNVLKRKGLKLFTFSLFTVVSTFSNCGFVPTNENMMVFSKNYGFLLILIPQVLLGNTLFPPCLRLSIWFLGKFVKKVKSNSDYLLKNAREIGYLHLLPSLHSSLLVVTVIGFILIQFILFCAMEWKSQALSGLDSFEKVVGVLFQTVNSRHTGESIVDLSSISAAILVLFIVMMYLPPYTAYFPVGKGYEDKCPQACERKKKRMGKVMENLILSQLSYLAIFIILICITERKKMKEDPLNFNVLNIVVEVVSAYGNVGFSTGYSCERQIKPDGNCIDKWYGFSGKWSDEGKIILILVMFFGRLKQFNMNGGQAWNLL